MTQTIVTHNNIYHADDVLAVATLLLVYPGSKIVRSRDEKDWSVADIVVDVGARYDPQTMRFDHHQEGGAGKRENGIPYASFGLVWKEFGPRLADVDVCKEIEKTLVMPVDAEDNGVVISSPLFEELSKYTISDFFDSFVDHTKINEEHLHEAFMQAVTKATALLEREIRNTKNYLASVERFRKIVEESKKKNIITLDEYLPWREVLVPIAEALYIVSPRPDGKWSVQAVYKEMHGYERKKYFPESWAGKQGQDLVLISGVLDALFCHNHRFIAVAASKEGALKLAEIALNA